MKNVLTNNMLITKMHSLLEQLAIFTCAFDSYTYRLLIVVSYHKTPVNVDKSSANETQTHQTNISSEKQIMQYQ